MRWTQWVLACLVLTTGCGTQTGSLARDGAAQDGTKAGTDTGFPDVVTRRIGVFRDGPLAGAEDNLGSVTPDGRLLLFVDWDTGRSEGRSPTGRGPGNMALVNLETGEQRLITDYRAYAAYMEGLLSPDGTRAAFVRDTLPGQPLSPPDLIMELRVVNLDGSEDRQLITGGNMRMMDWSPDGTQVLLWAEGGAELTLVSVADGSARVVRDFDGGGFWDARFSRDGRWIAYWKQTAEQSPDRDIYVVDADDGGEVRVTRDGGRKGVIGWTADDALLYVTEEGDGSNSLWRLPMRDGRKTGDRELVKSGIWGGRFPRLVGDNLYHTVRTGGVRTGVYTAEVSPAGPLTSSPLVPVSRRDGNAARAIAWSPSGAQLAYVLNEPYGVQTLIIRSVATGAEREVTPEISQIEDLRWTEDERALVLRGRRDGSGGLFRYDLSSNQVEVIIAIPGFNAALLSPDGSTAYGIRENEEDRYRSIIARDLARGTERILMDSLDNPGRGYRMSLSPKGDRLAFAIGNDRHGRAAGLAVMPVDGGEPRLVYSHASPGFVVGPSSAWTPDGTHILFVTRETAGPTGQETMMSVPLDGGSARPVLTLETLGASPLRIHPDGRRVLFAAGTLIGGKPPVVEFWVMENLSPTEGPSAKGSR